MNVSKEVRAREALSKAVIDADHAWNGNVSDYRQHLVDSIMASGLIALAAEPASGEVEGELATVIGDLENAVDVWRQHPSEVYEDAALGQRTIALLRSQAAEIARLVTERDGERERCARIIEDHGHSNGRILAIHKHLAAAVRQGGAP